RSSPRPSRRGPCGSSRERPSPGRRGRAVRAAPPASGRPSRGTRGPWAASYRSALGADHRRGGPSARTELRPVRAAEDVGDAANQAVDLFGREGAVGGPELHRVADVLATRGKGRSLEDVEQHRTLRQTV